MDRDDARRCVINIICNCNYLPAFRRARGTRQCNMAAAAVCVREPIAASVRRPSRAGPGRTGARLQRTSSGLTDRRRLGLRNLFSFGARPATAAGRGRMSEFVRSFNQFGLV
jgi:hypothetical protein